MTVSRKAGIAVGAVAALAASFAGGMAVTGLDGQRTVAGEDVVRQPIVLANADLAPAASCDELLDWYVEHGVALVGPYGWDSPIYYATDSAPSAAAPERVTSSATGTNVQEAGVDEPDVVKTDGELLVRVQDRDLVTYDVLGDQPVRLGSLGLPMEGAELLLAGDRVLVVMASDQESLQEPGGAQVLVVDVADPDRPTVVDEAVFDASLVTARQHGGTVRLVLSAGLPDLDFVEPGSWGRSEDSALEKNREIVRDSTIDDWLPTVTRDDDSGKLLDCDDVAIPSADAGLGTLAVVGIDPSEPETWSVAGVATTSQTTYFSSDRMYLASGHTAPTIWDCCPEPLPLRAEDHDGATDLYAFALDGTEATYLASGTVDGAIRDRWAMDESGGVLRVAVGPTVRTGNFNSVVTLEEDDDDLVEIGRVDKLGVNETIQSVRWFDELAVVVTFRQVDPLYAVDLTDPASPRLLGKLKIPGFSEYLHPLGRNRMLGLGQGPGRGRSWGAQASLFNVSDLTDPRQIDVVHYRGGSVTGAGTDPRQFTWLPQTRTVLTVISSRPAMSGGRTGWVSVLTLDGGPIEKRMVEVEYGLEVDDVRTVPLPDGRVLLVTGDRVSVFPL